MFTVKCKVKDLRANISVLTAFVADLYYDWVNDYLTVEKFASDHNISVEKAKEIIKLGRSTYSK